MSNIRQSAQVPTPERSRLSIRFRDQLPKQEEVHEVADLDFTIAIEVGTTS